MTDPKCDICGAAVDYRNSGKRWSSIRGDDNGVEGVRTCSDICRDTPKCAELIADYNEREIAAEKPFRAVAKKRAKQGNKWRNTPTCVFCCIHPCECGY